ncbi:MAG: DUF2147 domain-containing protein [Rhodospirillaceae bacterium]
MKPIVLFFAVVAATRVVYAADISPAPVGLWFPPDRKAAIELSTCGGNSLCGRIAWIETGHLPQGLKEPPVDKHNPDPTLRTRPLCGLELVHGLEPSEPGVWGGSSIYNPEDGKKWQIQIKVVGPNILLLRGYVLAPLLGQNQQWTRAPTSFEASCLARTE